MVLTIKRVNHETEGFNTLQVRRIIPESEFADKLQIKWQGFSYLIPHFEKPN